ncbi:cytosine deaminase [Salmonella enterica subsp. arizonae]|uniref:Cytosine deaminase n=1 Tax=Salmonella enterica subsp. arizonae TaxID=59203 RepID=A0A2X4T0Z0_SALER|nr:cytosine deaminase [Salmonella enterica subsp. arizonae]
MPKVGCSSRRLLSRIFTSTPRRTAGEPSWNQSGTLFEGIERWAERKAMLTHEDVKSRAMQTLQVADG